MKIEYLAKLVREMREAQVVYFSAQRNAKEIGMRDRWRLLSTAKELERRVDAAVSKVLDS